jgi:hypothetical protein
MRTPDVGQEGEIKGPEEMRKVGKTVKGSYNMNGINSDEKSLWVFASG